MFILFFSSNIVDQVENTDNSVSTTNCEHVTLVGEVSSKYGATEFFDLSDRLEGIDGVEDLDFVASRSSCNDVLTGGLHELSAVDLARRRRLEVTVIPRDVIK